LLHPDFKFFFAGDTGYSNGFKLIGDKFGYFNLAALPIGGYAPREIFSGAHITPEEAVNIHQDISAQRSIGIHWGTYVLTDEPYNEPVERLRSAITKNNMDPNEFITLKHGESTITENS